MTHYDIDGLNQLIKDNPHNLAYYFERAKVHFRHDDFGSAINDLNTVLELDPKHVPAAEMLEMVRSILGFHNTDMYNP